MLEHYVLFGEAEVLGDNDYAILLDNGRRLRLNNLFCSQRFYNITSWIVEVV